MNFDKTKKHLQSCFFCLCLTVTIPRNSEQRKSQTETIPKK